MKNRKRSLDIKNVFEFAAGHQESETGSSAFLSRRVQKRRHRQSAAQLKQCSSNEEGGPVGSAHRHAGAVV